MNFRSLGGTAIAEKVKLSVVKKNKSLRAICSQGIEKKSVYFFVAEIIVTADSFTFVANSNPAVFVGSVTLPAELIRSPDLAQMKWEATEDLENHAWLIGLAVVPLLLLHPSA